MRVLWWNHSEGQDRPYQPIKLAVAETGPLSTAPDMRIPLGDRSYLGAFYSVFQSSAGDRVGH